MSTNEIANFTDSVNALIEGKLILINKHIAQVLKCVAASPTLCRALADTLKNMSYATEFSRALVTWTHSDGTVERSLKLPIDRNRLFAFVVCLLTEVDSGKRNILEFIKEYYNAGDNESSYKRFADEALKPFKQAGVTLLSVIDPESLDNSYTEQAERFFRAERIYIDTATVTGILGEVEEIRCVVLAAKPLREALDEYNAVSEYLVNALYLKNPKIISLAFIAYKYTALQYADAATHLVTVAELLDGVLPRSDR